MLTKFDDEGRPVNLDGAVIMQQGEPIEGAAQVPDEDKTLANLGRKIAKAESKLRPLLDAYRARQKEIKQAAWRRTAEGERSMARRESHADYVEQQHAQIECVHAERVRQAKRQVALDALAAGWLKKNRIPDQDERVVAEMNRVQSAKVAEAVIGGA